MDGRGNVQMTGKLGDVMQESVQIAVSYIRSIARQYHIEGAFFRKHDIHVHVPEGAVPKDGPSAGITMATAILSAITDIPVKQDVAMTGEITLRGMVLPIGGLKEKLLAAKVDGMKTVCVPEANKRDVEEIDTEITEGLNIVYVKRMDTVLQTAFVKGEK
jgi:ATP-dependent Lon protease